MHPRHYKWVIVWVILLGTSFLHAASLERFVMPGAVSAAHADLEDECSSCHSPLLDEPQAGLCVACHENVGQDLAAEIGFHGRHPDVATNECQVCHTEHEGRDANTLTFDLTQFDHEITDFPLRWAHTQIECDSCHQANAAFSTAPNTCVGCHQLDDPHDTALGVTCGDCHTQRNWQETRFDHAQTNFALLGRHDALSCTSCHANNQFAGTPSECVACHQSDDKHKGSLGSQCQQCHGADTWAREAFDHQSTGFPLTLGHAKLTCDSCHTSLPLSNLGSSTCLSCHAGNDVHEGNNGSVCASCHDTTGWTSLAFDHAIRTGFRLKGAHAELKCTSCHSGALTEPISKHCGECHSQDDPHAGQLGTECATCHNETTWTDGIRFDHDLAMFPLIGKHANLACDSCHNSLTFRIAASNCVACHAKDEVHQNSLGSKCQTCHSPVDWRLTTFDHEAVAEFALDGVHSALECTACHTKAVFLKAPTADSCVVCHRQDDPHQTRFGNDCARCHGTESFTEIERF